MNSFLSWLTSDGGGPQDVKALVSKRDTRRRSANVWNLILQDCMVGYGRGDEYRYSFVWDIVFCGIVVVGIGWIIFRTWWFFFAKRTWVWHAWRVSGLGKRVPKISQRMVGATETQCPNENSVELLVEPHVFGIWWGENTQLADVSLQKFKAVRNSVFRKEFISVLNRKMKTSMQ